MARGRRRYRMTPARRAALKKAQEASARKRRRKQNIRRAGVAVGAFGVLTATRQLNRYSRDFRQIGRDYRDLKAASKKANARRKAIVQKFKTKRAMRGLKNQQYTLW